MSNEIISHDGMGVIVTREGDPGRTLYGDRHPDAPVKSTRRAPGPAEPNDAPCSCAIFTYQRGTASVHCYTCGGLERVTEPRAKLPGADHG